MVGNWAFFDFLDLLSVTKKSVSEIMNLKSKVLIYNGESVSK